MYRSAIYFAWDLFLYKLDAVIVAAKYFADYITNQPRYCFHLQSPPSSLVSTRILLCTGILATISSHVYPACHMMSYLDPN